MEPIEKSLLQFINNEDGNPFKVAAIKGEWGVGKTYYWKKFLDKYKDDLDFRAYSYVSLFGATSINQLKQDVFTNFEKLDSSEEKNIKLNSEWLKPFANGLKDLDIPIYNPSKSISDWVEKAFVNNFLVCIDDLERKEDEISVSSILGFISWLKEEKNCKILLIYNEDQLDSDTASKFDEYREKIVDLDLTFRPTIDQNLTYVWEDRVPGFVSVIFNAFEVNNIRIMQKAKWLNDHIETKLSTNTFLKQKATYNAIVLTILHHTVSNRNLLNQVAKGNLYLHLLEAESEEKVEEIKIRKIIESIEYISSDFDQAILDYLSDGYINWEKYSKLVQRQNELEKKDAAYKKLLQIQQKVMANFSVPTDVIVKEFQDFLNDNLPELSISDVVRTCDYLLMLDKSINVEPYIEKAEDLFVSNSHEFLLEESTARYMQITKEMHQSISKKFKQKKHSFTISEVIKMLDESSGRPAESIYLLQQFSETEILNWLKETQDPDFLLRLNNFLRRYEFTEDEISKTEYLKIVKCLRQIKSINDLQNKRVDSLRIREIQKDGRANSQGVHT